MRDLLSRRPRIQLRTIKITDNPEPNVSMTKLKEARTKVRDLAEVVRDDVFNDWIERYVVSAKRSDEWTQARTLYDAYSSRAAQFGSNRTEKAIAREEVASETQWGRMMGSLFPTKKRRRNGWHYPVRLKQLG
tara:strand:+ start:8827 stop:9225 length:399 start_codon:yes stop_codon:yes gene_type:complete